MDFPRIKRLPPYVFNVVQALVEAAQKPVNHRLKVAVSPGVGFGEYADHHVRFALLENEHRTRQACRSIRRALGGSAAHELRASAG